MENASKALEIAAGVLLGVLLMALVAHFFSNIGVVEVEEDETTLVEQTKKFNMEYEAYHKSAMYGVDVISCLNKAQSNNEKYVDQEAFYVGLTGTTGDYKKFGTDATGGSSISDKYFQESTDYTIDIEIKLKHDLEEKVTISYYDNDPQSNTYGKNVTYYGLETEQKVALNKAIPSILNKVKKENPLIDINNIYTSFDIDTGLGDAEGEHTIVTSTGAEIDQLKVGDYYSLMFDSKERLVKLLNLVDSDNFKITINNTASDSSLSVWKSFTWETAIFSFKQKKFKCTEINYSPITGRVKQMKFEEINLGTEN